MNSTVDFKLLIFFVYCMHSAVQTSDNVDVQSVSIVRELRQGGSIPALSTQVTGQKNTDIVILHTMGRFHADWLRQQNLPVFHQRDLTSESKMEQGKKVMFLDEQHPPEKLCEQHYCSNLFYQNKPSVDEVSGCCRLLKFLFLPIKLTRNCSEHHHRRGGSKVVPVADDASCKL